VALIGEAGEFVQLMFHFDMYQQNIVLGLQAIKHYPVKGKSYNERSHIMVFLLPLHFIWQLNVLPGLVFLLFAVGAVLADADSSTRPTITT